MAHVICDLQAVTSDLSPVPEWDLIVWSPDCACCCQLQHTSKALPHVCSGLDRTVGFYSSLRCWRKSGGRGKKKVKERHTEWQLPQLLAGVLIKTKLVSLREQTWQALKLRSFFSVLPRCKVSAGASGMPETKRSDLSLSFAVFLSLVPLLSPTFHPSVCPSISMCHF